MISLYSIFFVKCLIIYLIKRKYGAISAPFFILIIFFFYSQCFFIDYILFGIEEIGYYGRFVPMSIFSDDYLFIVILYLTFFLGFGSVLIFANPPSLKIKEVHVYKENKSYNLLLIISVCILIIYTIQNIYGVGRLEKNQFLISNKLLSIPINVATFGWLILFFKNIVNQKRSILFYILSFAIILYGILEGGREIFLYILFAYLFSREKTSLNLKQIFLGIVVFIFLTFWKVISIFVIKLNDIPRLIDYFQRQFQFSFTAMDPLNSLLMIRDFNLGDSFYDQFQFSYITNTIKQILRTFNLIEYDSFAESIALYYIPEMQKMGAGLASSGILESMLNFWYFGPAILGIILGLISIKVYYIKYKSTFLYGVLSLFLTILCFKLVRTELAVVLKIYFLPMLVAYFFFYKLSFSKMIRDVKF